MLATTKKSGKALLAAGRLLAQIIAPYFAQVFYTLVVRESREIPTVVVTSDGFLIYNPNFLDGLTIEQAAFLWLHEGMHIFGRHAFRCGPTRNRDDYNESADRWINTLVRDMRGPKGQAAAAPSGDFVWKEGGSIVGKGGVWPKDHGWPEGKSIDWYYDELQKKKKQQKSGDGEKKVRGCLGGGCGSCAGNGHDAEPKNDPHARTPADMDRVVRDAAEQIRKRAENPRTAGTLPAGLRVLADAVLAPPKIDWRAKLATLARQAASYRAGAQVYRYGRPSRFQAGLGHGPGRPILPRLYSPIPRVAAALDLSGSMGKREIAESIVEIGSILRTVDGGAEFASFDAEVHALVSVKNLRDVAKNMRGGGGTDFRPVFRAFEKRKTRPDILVILTDGYGPAPEKAPTWCRTIWVLVGGNEQSPAKWGDVVVVDRDEERSAA